MASTRGKTKQHKVAEEQASEEPILINIEEAARMLLTTTRHVKRLAYERRLPYVKVGRFVRFEKHRVLQWIEDHRVAVFDRSSVRRGSW